MRAISCIALAMRIFIKTISNRPACSLPGRPRPLPWLKLNPAVGSIFDFLFEDIVLDAYDPHPSIPAPVAVSGRPPGCWTSGVDARNPVCDHLPAR